ncbi:ladderlectin-like [Seriola dumerili]|uniref:ladderlectin-like n=1 Tax=Seriola dumerili TaxID=41447 RepID=UPI000BBE4284|nr:ladderlectin-like [Seriola dumerili]
MKVPGVCLTLCSLLTLSRAVPLNSTNLLPKHAGLCEYARLQCYHDGIGAFCPTCDTNGNFLPQQCWPSSGYCWCVDVLSGEEIPNTQSPLGSVHHCSSEYYCPKGWTYFGKKCFTFIDSPKTWAEAEIYCLFEGANLASIHCYEESHFVMSLTRGDTNSFPQTWIGGFSAIHPGFWMWSDGSKFHYENWHHDHSSDGPDKACLKINYKYDLKWYYESCTESLPFVCSKKI